MPRPKGSKNKPKTAKPSGMGPKRAEDVCRQTSPFGSSEEFYSTVVKIVPVIAEMDKNRALNEDTRAFAAEIIAASLHNGSDFTFESIAMSSVAMAHALAEARKLTPAEAMNAMAARAKNSVKVVAVAEPEKESEPKKDPEPAVTP